MEDVMTRTSTCDQHPDHDAISNQSPVTDQDGGMNQYHRFYAQRHAIKALEDMHYMMDQEAYWGDVAEHLRRALSSAEYLLEWQQEHTNQCSYLAESVDRAQARRNALPAIHDSGRRP